MAVDPRAPVLVGVGQVNNRVDRGSPALEPIDLVAEALRAAEADTGARGVLAAADSVRIVNILSWRYRDPGRLVAQRVAAAPRETVHTTGGGNTPQMVVNRTALDIQAGHADVVLIGGAEAWRTRMALRREERKPSWTPLGESSEPTRTLGTELDMGHESEMAQGIVLPVQMYPLFDSALRAARGWTIDEHRDRLGALWSRFSEVAASNPHAWIQQRFTPEEIRDPSPDNRMVGFPYTKLMNSNNHVEQGAALVMCSAERAAALGIPQDRWVFPVAGSDAQDHAYVTDRDELCASPAIRLAGQALLDSAGVGAEDVAHVDLYSCFPSAVQVAANELGLSGERDLTITGGMSFAGGPWNNYVTHSIAAMAGVLREEPAELGLCSANGGFLAKHSLGLYAATPPAQGFRHASPQEAVDRLPRREPAGDHEGEVVVEAYTVMHDRDGEPETGIFSVLTADGRRGWATSDDAGLLDAAVTQELIGSAGHRASGGTIELR